jgi:endogenous inhibitor of DNA gyrase (YacG/DUF329 family)
MSRMCASCNATLDDSWFFCPFCGKLCSTLNPPNPAVHTNSNDKKIAERFLILANDYRSLTGHALANDVLDEFIKHAASGPLSVVESARRMKAGKNCRKSLGNGKFALDLNEWLESVYEVPETEKHSRVWITDGGGKYHSSRDCNGMRSGQEFARWKGKDTYNPQFISIRRAAYILGLSPCLVCKPPRFSEN